MNIDLESQRPHFSTEVGSIVRNGLLAVGCFTASISWGCIIYDIMGGDADEAARDLYIGFLGFSVLTAGSFLAVEITEIWDRAFSRE